MIKIISEKIVLDENGIVSSRHVDVIITNGAESYLWGVGGLPLTGDLETILDAREPELWAVASAAGIVVPAEVTAKQEAKQFMADNPSAKLLIELDLAALETTIENRTAEQETRLLKTLTVAVRYLYEKEKMK